jgi:5,10-methylenetetrahydromethanopterin reductase
MRIGVALPLEAPAGELLELAAEVERLGYDAVWCNDDRLQHDVVAMLAAIAQRTDRVLLGPGVTNPYSRHAALIATAIATLDELSDGRARLGLGAGGTNHRALGVRREAPAAALREAVGLIRGLLSGERVTVDGRVVHAEDARLDFAPRRADVPVLIGARGPRVLELAGELADGVIVGNIATRDGWSYALGRIEEGARRAGRDPASVEVCAWLYTCVADDPDAAADAIRPMVGTSLTTSRPILAELGIEMPGQFAAAMERAGWRLDAEVVREAARSLPRETVDGFGLAGTAEECRARLGALLDGHPRIAEVVIVPFAAAGQRTIDVIERFIEDVAPVGAPVGGPDLFQERRPDGGKG